MSEKLENLKLKLEKAKEVYKDIGTEVFAEQVKTIFEKYKDLNEFKWTQIIPYFNDGDTCDFRIDQVYVLTNSNEDFKGEYDGVENDEIVDQLFEDIRDILEQNDNLIEELYGEHSEITIKKDGTVTVEEYTDHD